MQSLQSQLKILEASATSPLALVPLARQLLELVRSFWGAWRTIAGYEAIHMIRKGQACCSATGAKVGLLHRFIVGMFGMEA